MTRKLPRSAFKKGNPGRPKGCKNKFTTLKNEFIEAFLAVGGREYVKKYAKGDNSQKGRFLQMIATMLPKDIQLTGSEGGPISIVIVKPATEQPTPKGSADSGTGLPPG